MSYQPPLTAGLHFLPQAAHSAQRWRPIPRSSRGSWYTELQAAGRLIWGADGRGQGKGAPPGSQGRTGGLGVSPEPSRSQRLQEAFNLGNEKRDLMSPGNWLNPSGLFLMENSLWVSEPAAERAPVPDAREKAELRPDADGGSSALTGVFSFTTSQQK